MIAKARALELSEVLPVFWGPARGILYAAQPTQSSSESQHTASLTGQINFGINLRRRVLPSKASELAETPGPGAQPEKPGGYWVGPEPGGGQYPPGYTRRVPGQWHPYSVVVVFTSNRSFYPTSAVLPPLSFLIILEIQILRSSRKTKNQSRERIKVYTVHTVYTRQMLSY